MHNHISGNDAPNHSHSPQPKTPKLAIGKIEDTQNFLTALTQGYADPASRLEIRVAFPAWRQAALYPKGDAPHDWQFRTGKRAWFPLTIPSIEAAARYALQCARRYEVYFGVLPRIGNSEKGVDVPAAACLWADIDGGFEGVEGTQARLDAAVQVGRLPAPHFTICSGGGLHVYWLLSAQITLTDEIVRRRVKDTLKRLCRVIGGNAPAAHADTSRAEVASILRVPGTFNRKRENEPRSVRLLPGSPAEPHTLAWWNANLPALPAPPAPKYPAPDYSQPSVSDGLIRWARTPYPEGNRHKDLAGAAAWLVREVKLMKELAKELLLMKAQASSGLRAIGLEEVEALIEWA